MRMFVFLFLLSPLYAQVLYIGNIDLGPYTHIEDSKLRGRGSHRDVWGDQRLKNFSLSQRLRNREKRKFLILELISNHVEVHLNEKIKNKHKNVFFVTGQAKVLTNRPLNQYFEKISKIGIILESENFKGEHRHELNFNPERIKVVLDRDMNSKDERLVNFELRDKADEKQFKEIFNILYDYFSEDQSNLKKHKIHAYLVLISESGKRITLTIGRESYDKIFLKKKNCSKLMGEFK